VKTAGTPLSGFWSRILSLSFMFLFGSLVNGPYGGIVTMKEKGNRMERQLAIFLQVEHQVFKRA